MQSGERFGLRPYGARLRARSFCTRYSVTQYSSLIRPARFRGARRWRLRWRGFPRSSRRACRAAASSCQRLGHSGCFRRRTSVLAPFITDSTCPIIRSRSSFSSRRSPNRSRSPPSRSMSRCRQVSLRTRRVNLRVRAVAVDERVHGRGEVRRRVAFRRWRVSHGFCATLVVSVPARLTLPLRLQKSRRFASLPIPSRIRLL